MSPSCLLLALTCLLPHVTLALPHVTNSALDDVWTAFKLVHSKTYSPGEEVIRRRQWEENVELIDKHNLEHDLGLHTYRMAVNQFADWSKEEYVEHMLGARPEPATRDYTLRFTPQPGAQMPLSVNWTDKGYVTPIKNQGQCGSCWAFSSTGALEGAHFAKTGRLVSLSEQNLVDCVAQSHGCHGGWMDYAFDYVQRAGGIDTEDSYPYEAKDDHCHFNKTNVGSSCAGHVDLPSGDEIALQQAVARVGPISVAIDAAHHSFMFYKTGIFFDYRCAHNRADHAVLVVGYGQENGYDYWLIKNSWSTKWGDHGYIKMARNYNNMCAIATYATYPLV